MDNSQNSPWQKWIVCVCKRGGRSFNLYRWVLNIRLIGNHSRILELYFVLNIPGQGHHLPLLLLGQQEHNRDVVPLHNQRQEVRWKVWLISCFEF